VKFKYKNYSQKEKFIKRVLKKILKEHSHRWLGDQPFHYKFDINQVLDDYDNHVMQVLKEHLSHTAAVNENIRPVYEKVKDFKRIKDLLYYLRPKFFETPESILLYYLHRSSKYKIKQCERPGYYNLLIKEEVDPEMIIKKENIARSLKTFFRSYTQLLLDVKKKPLNIFQLFELLLNEEVGYSYGKQKEVFIYLRQKNQKTIKEMLKLAAQEEVKAPLEIYENLVFKDHNRFFRIINNYPGSENWDEEVKLKVYLKLFDNFYKQGGKEEMAELGPEILDMLEEGSAVSSARGKTIRRLINREIKD